MQSLPMAYVLDETPLCAQTSLELVSKFLHFNPAKFDIVMEVPPAVCLPSALLILLGVRDAYAYFAVQSGLALGLVWGCERVGTFLYGPRCGLICAAVALSCPVLNSDVRIFTPDVLAGTAMIWEVYAFLRLRASGGWRYQLLFAAMMLLLLNKGTGMLYAFPLWVCALVEFVWQGDRRGDCACRAWNRWEWAFSWSGLVVLLGGCLLQLRVVTVLLLAVIILALAHRLNRCLRPSVQMLTCCGQTLAIAGVYFFYRMRGHDFSSYMYLNASSAEASAITSWSDALGRLFADYIDHIINDVMFPHLALLLVISVLAAAFERRWRPRLELVCLVLLPGQILNLLFFNYIEPRYAAVWLGTAAVIMGAFLAHLWRPGRVMALLALVFYQLFMVGGWMLGPGLPPANYCYMHPGYLMCGRRFLAPNSHHPEGAGWKWWAKVFSGQHHWAATYFCTLYPFRSPNVEKLVRCWRDWDCRHICRKCHLLVCDTVSAFEYSAQEALNNDPVVGKSTRFGYFPVSSVGRLDIARAWLLATHHQAFIYLILSLDIPELIPVDQQRRLMEGVIRQLGPKWEMVYFSPASNKEGAFALCANGVFNSLCPWRPLLGGEHDLLLEKFPIDSYFSDRCLRGLLP